MKPFIPIHRKIWLAAASTIALALVAWWMPAAAQEVVQPGDFPVYAPLLFIQFPPPAYAPTTTALFCSSPSLAIPDNTLEGASNTITVGDVQVIADLDVYLDIAHTWVGDLVVNLTHLETGKMVTLVDRPGVPASEEGCNGNHFSSILDDEITLPVESRCISGPPAISGTFLPNNPLSAFDGELVTGNWMLTVSDQHNNDTGTLYEWCLSAKISTAPPPPTPTPVPPELPSRASIENISGQKQALPLDCESRSAVDWAGYFGYRIDELMFFNQLPKSDNPDKGFVGDVNAAWGQIPPNSYGIHAEPVANLLRDYGVPAHAHRPLTWDALRAEIAAGRPVFVWVIGAAWNGIPQYFTPPDWLHTVVARYEHTVIVSGYTPTSVTILNGASSQTVSLDQFLESWSVLGNMAITANP